MALSVDGKGLPIDCLRSSPLWNLADMSANSLTVCATFTECTLPSKHTIARCRLQKSLLNLSREPGARTRLDA